MMRPLFSLEQDTRCLTDASVLLCLMIICAVMGSERVCWKLDSTHKIANLRGRKLKIGSSVKQTMKRATAAKLRPPKSNNRSHRDTVGDGVSNVSGASSGRQCINDHFKDHRALCSSSQNAGTLQ